MKKVALGIVILLVSYRTYSREGSVASEPCRVTGHESIRSAYARYVPSDPVRIFGEGFAPSCGVMVAVTRPDGSAVTGGGSGTAASEVVTTDEDGTLSYLYNLGALAGSFDVHAQGAAASFTSGPYVQTDAEDYHPGAAVTVTGAGWQPGEIVTLSFQELPDIHADTTLTAQADARGTIFNSDFRPDEHDAGVAFVLTAIGSSGRAVASFNDGPPAAGDFRSHQSGDWNAPSTWERFDGTDWITPAPSTPGCAPPCAPSTSSVQIQAAHEVSVTEDVAMDAVTVDPGGALAVGPGAAATLVNGSPNPDMTVNGALVVQDGGLLSLSGSSSTAPNSELVVNGSASVAGTMEVRSRAAVTVNGTLEAPGDLMLSGGSGSTKGSLTVAPSGSFILSGTGSGALASVGLQGKALISGSFTGGTNSDVTISSTGAVTVSGSMNLGFGSSSPWTVNGALTYTGNGGSDLTGGSGSANPMTVNSPGVVSLGPSNVISSSTGGPFRLNAGAELRIGSIAGIAATSNSGNIQTAGTRTFNAGAFYAYNGTSAQITGNGLPASVARLTIDNASGVTVLPPADKTVTAALMLVSGPLSPGANKVIVPSTAVASSAGGWVSGNLQEGVAAGTNVLRSFPVGTGTAANPVTITFASVSAAGNVTARATSGDNLNIGSSTLSPSRSVNDSWTLTNSGVAFSSAAAAYGFNAGDLDAGVKTGSLIVGEFSGGVWSYPAVSGRTATSTAASGITVLSGAFAVAEPGDTTPPDVSIASGPANPTNGASATLAFAGTDDQTPAASLTFQCELDGGGFIDCSSPQSYAGPLSEGSHAFSVEATDLAGNTSLPVSFSWRVDTTPPDTVLDSGPSSPTNSASAALAFHSTESGSTFQCRVDGGAYSPCGSPASYSGLAPGSHTFQVRATDAAGNTDPTPASDTWTINGPPSDVGLAVTPGAIDEGGTATVNGSFADAGDSGSHTVTISWGDGSPNSVLTVPGGTFTFSAAHQYADDDPTATAQDVNSIAATVTDGGGLSASGAANVTIRNMAPSVTSVTGPPSPIAMGGSATIAAKFTDAGARDTHTCAFTWNETPASTSSAGTVTEAGGNGSCDSSHTYASPGVYAVNVTVSDDDAGVAAGVFQYVVVYDKDAGFVTGGGWIVAPAGSLPASPAATGKANYGFNAKYQDGKPLPEGSTELQFKEGSLSFKSTSYDWLVISGGYKAQYKGHGTINGTGNYALILTVIDGSRRETGAHNEFRIKIYDESGAGAVIFDNNVGASDTADPTTVPGGGSIVLHK